MKERLKEVAAENGIELGIAPVQRLGGLPSMDPEYLLKGTRTVIALMAPLDAEIIRRYLGKEDRAGYQDHETEVYRKLFWTGRKLAALIKSEGYESIVPEPNLDYRWKDGLEYRFIPYRIRQTITDWFARDSNPPVISLKRRLAGPLHRSSYRSVDWNLTPSFSARYAAVAAGLGRIGWSSNVLHPQHGARILYSCVLTRAQLEPDPMLDENPCDGCRTCVKVCQSGYIDARAEDHVTIGGKMFTHAKKSHNLRCIFVCANFSGQNLHPEWSTWCPGRITLPETDVNIEEFWDDFVVDNLWRNNFYSRALAQLSHHNEYGFIRKPEDRFVTTCGNCQLVCSKTRDERKENYEILAGGGVVVEDDGGGIRVTRRSD